MKSNIEILSEIFKPTSFDCKTEIEDLQIAITLNPDLSKIIEAMEKAYYEGFQNGAVEAQNDAASEIREHYVAGH